MARSGFVRSGLPLLAILAGACADLPSAAAPGDPAAARAADAYTVTDVGALIAGFSSVATGVNDAGSVSGYTCCGAGAGAFVTMGGGVVPLGGELGSALAVSDGSPGWAVGYAGATSQPVRWRLDDPATPIPLGLLPDALTSWGAARGVNDAGDAVGNVGSVATLWGADGLAVPVSAPAGFVKGEGRGINDDGDAVFEFAASTSSWEGSRGFVRLASGALAELPPVGADITTYANGLSDRVGGLLYVAGSTRGGAFASRSVRWTVDAATGLILATDVRGENSHGLAPSNAGAVAGFLEANAARTPRLTAFLWRGAELLRLDPPRRGRDGRAWATSESGRYVAGEAFVGGVRHAVLWNMTAP